MINQACTQQLSKDSQACTTCMQITECTTQHEVTNMHTLDEQPCTQQLSKDSRAYTTSMQIAECTTHHEMTNMHTLHKQPCMHRHHQQLSTKSQACTAMQENPKMYNPAWRAVHAQTTSTCTTLHAKPRVHKSGWSDKHAHTAWTAMHAKTVRW